MNGYDYKRIARLLIRQRFQVLTLHEEVELNQWVKQDPANKALMLQLQDDDYVMREVLEFGEADWKKHWNRLCDRIPELKVVDITNLPIMEGDNGNLDKILSDDWE